MEKLARNFVDLVLPEENRLQTKVAGAKRFSANNCILLFDKSSSSKLGTSANRFASIVVIALSLRDKSVSWSRPRNVPSARCRNRQPDTSRRSKFVKFANCAAGGRGVLHADSAISW